MERDDLIRILDSLLFVADEPLTAAQLAKLVEVDAPEVAAALADLEQHCRERGIRVQSHAGAFQMVTAPECRPYVERLLGSSTERRLSGAAMEVLALVAYRQPITRAGIEAIRGVNSDRALRTLQTLGLVAETGRLETAGRPALFGTTFEFLQHFGLGSLADLPPMPTEAQSSGVELAEQLALPGGQPGVGSRSESPAPAVHAARRHRNNGREARTP